LCLVSVLAAGCARIVMDSSVVDQLSSPAAELDFWSGLESRGAVTVNDALHGLFIVADGADPYEAWDDRLTAARQRGWLPARAEPQANASASVGMVAVATCKILSIRGGLTMTLLGPTPRYCTRELVFLEILPPRSEHQSLSGIEFIDLVGRLEDHLDAAAGREG
jgi:hypothetical protein